MRLFAASAPVLGLVEKYRECLVGADDHRGDDQHEDVFFQRNADQLDACPQRDRENPDFQGVPVPDQRERVEDGDRPDSLAVDAGVCDQRDRDRPPEQFRDEIRVLTEDADIGKHSRVTCSIYETMTDPETGTSANFDYP